MYMPTGVYERTQYHKDVVSSSWNKRRLRFKGPNLGKKMSDATKLKISISKKGTPSPNKGRVMSDEQKQKISLNRKGKTAKENNPNWKGGISNKDRMERCRFKKQLQKKILARDSYKCVLCSNGGRLQVDHIKN
jgi:hypothetical protein